MTVTEKEGGIVSLPPSAQVQRQRDRGKAVSSTSQATVPGYNGSAVSGVQVQSDRASHTVPVRENSALGDKGSPPNVT